MRRARVLAWTSVAAAILLGGSAAEAADDALSSSVDRDAITTELGHSFATRTTIENTGASGVTGAIAHLNVLSLASGTYVDPEDWSSRRTRYLAPLPAGRSTTVAWQLHAVSPGRFVVYVALVRADGSGLLGVGPPVRVTVSDRTTLNSGGIVPLALGIPLLLGLAWAAVGLRRRRRAREL